MFPVYNPPPPPPPPVLDQEVKIEVLWDHMLIYRLTNCHFIIWNMHGIFSKILGDKSKDPE